MVNIKGTTVYMVRGDTVDLSIEIKDQDGAIYTPTFQSTRVMHMAALRLAFTGVVL